MNIYYEYILSNHSLMTHIKPFWYLRFKSIATLIFLALEFANGQQPNMAVNMIPKSPQMAGLDKYIQYPTIGGNGIPDISIPIYTLNYKGISIPISLSYHASGIKVNDISSTAGLGWSLQCGGSISRDVQGRPDEIGGWFGFDSIMAEQTCSLNDLKGYYEGSKDVAADIYSYTLPKVNGSFIYIPSKQIKHTDKEILINVDSTESVLYPNYIITDAQGIQYFFFPSEYTKISRMDGDGNPSFSFDYMDFTLVGWQLSRINLLTGDSILFSYEENDFSTNYYQTGTALRKSSAVEVMNNPEHPCYGMNIPELSEVSRYLSLTEYQTTLPKSITTPNEEVTFYYASDTSLSIMKKKLTAIVVKSKIGNELIDSITFTHDSYSGDPRLRLREVSFYGCDSESGFENPDPKEYFFNYENSALHEIGHPGQDIFGYQNGNTVWHMLPPYPEGVISGAPIHPGHATREVDSTIIMNGILNEIVFPTGGKIRYSFEPNTDAVYTAPGVRVRKIEFLNEYDTIVESRFYTYYGLTGFLHQNNNYNDYYVYHPRDIGTNREIGRAHV